MSTETTPASTETAPTEAPATTTPTKTIIHVDKGLIAQNKLDGTNYPVIKVIESDGKIRRGNQVVVDGVVEFKYRPGDPLEDTGTTAWAETDEFVQVYDEYSEQNFESFFDCGSDD
jgi:hypothetical protein